MKELKMKIKDKSTISKREYLLDHVLYGAIFAYNTYNYLPFFAPILYYKNSVLALIVCMVITSFFGIVFTYNYNRNGCGVIIDIIAGLGLYTAVIVGPYAQEFIKILIVVTLSVTVVDILLIMCRKVRNKSQKKHVLFARFPRSTQVIRWCFGVAAVVLLVLPASIHFFKNEKLAEAYYEMIDKVK